MTTKQKAFLGVIGWLLLYTAIATPIYVIFEIGEGWRIAVGLFVGLWIGSNAFAKVMNEADHR